MIEKKYKQIAIISIAAVLNYAVSVSGVQVCVGKA